MSRADSIDRGQRAPLLQEEPQTTSPLGDTDTDTDFQDGVDGPWSHTQSTRRIYVSHLLSTANSRIFEFGSVLYLAALFPGTLLPLSVYALARSAAAILLSSSVGSYIDREDRLKVVRLSIVSQRLVVAASCVCFYVLAKVQNMSQEARVGFLALLVPMACVEKLASIMNLVSVERDWVVVIADDDVAILRTMNSQMRRIDLACKLLGPLLIGLVDGVSTELAILVNLGMNCISVVIEYFAIAQVYYQVPELQRPKAEPVLVPIQDDDQQRRRSCWTSIKAAARKWGQDMVLYLRHPAFRASFACALLYFTVLAFNGQMVTYLLSRGYSAVQIATLRTVSAGFEILATWAAPWLISRIGPIRSGLWFSSWQLACLAVGMSVFWMDTGKPDISTLGLVVGTMFSRVGLWGFDLSTQLIVQEEVEAESRGAFSAVEASWQNALEMCSYASTAIMSSPDQFKWPASTSVGAVLCAWALYMSFVRARRGHLVHLPSCIVLPEKRQRSTGGLLSESPRGSRERL